MKFKKKHIWFILTLLVLLTLHLRIFIISTFQVSLGFVLIPLWVYTTFKIPIWRFSVFEKLMLLFLIILPFISGNIENWSEFVSTYGQYLITYFLVIRAINKRLKISLVDIDSTLRVFQIILVLTVIVQFCLVVLLGKSFFFNIFQEYQLHYSLDYNLSVGRMKAFYLEPSYLGFVTVCIYWTRLYLTKSNGIVDFNIMVTLLILTLTKSSSSFLSFGILFTFYFITRNSTKTKSYSLILSACIVWFIYLYFGDEVFALLRLNELSGNSENPVSGFMRVTLPIQILQKMFSDGYFLGLTFGQLDGYAYKMMILYGEKGISNSFFLLIGYFGLISIFILCYLLYYFFCRSNTLQKSFMIFTFFNLNNSGAFVTSQFGFIAFLIPIIVLNSNHKLIK